VGGRYAGFELVGILAQPEPIAVLERNFGRWGLFAYIGYKGPVATIRKAVGAIDSVPPPREAFPAGYYDNILRGQEDILARPVLAGGKAPSYASVAGVLPPLDSYTFLGTISSEKKVMQLTKKSEKQLLDMNELYQKNHDDFVNKIFEGILHS
jgi:hypothetical protein